MVINVAPALGPIVGGLLLQTGHWQWIFLANLPLGAVVLVAALAYLPADRPRPVTRDAKPAVRADLPGLVLLTVGFVALLYALTSTGLGTDGRISVVAAVVGVGLLAGYVAYALRTSRVPALDLRLLRLTGYAASLGVMALVGFTMYSLLTALPLLAGDRYGLTGVGRGLPVAALGVGLLVSMSNGARIGDRTGPKPLVRAGAIATATTLAVLAATHGRLPLAGALALLVLLGMVFGLTASPTFSGVYRLLPPDAQAQGTTSLFIAVQLAASLGVSLLGLLQARLPEHWLTVLFGLLALGALTMTVLSRWLPGRPGTAS